MFQQAHRKTLAALGLALVANLTAAHDTPEYVPATGQLTIPEVIVGTTVVYNAKLKLTGGSSFSLQSYRTVPPTIPSTTDAAALPNTRQPSTPHTASCVFAPALNCRPPPAAAIP
jgi:hypothetical protein